MKPVILYRRLLSYVRPHWKIFSASIAGTIVLAATQPAMPYLMKPLLDGSFVDKDPKMIVLMPILLIALSVIQGLATLISSVTMEMVATRVVFDLRTAMTERILSLPTSFYDNSTTGVVLSKITYDVDQLTSSASTVLVTLVRDSLAIIGLLGLLLYLNWKLTLIAFALIPLVIFFVRVVSQRLRRINRELQGKMGEMTHILEEIISGNKIIKLFQGQPHEQQRLGQSANKVRQLKVKNKIAHISSVQVNQFLAITCLALMAYLAAKQSAAGDFTVGEFVAFFGAMAMLLSPLKKLTSINSELQRGLAAADSVFTLLDQQAEPDLGSQSTDKLTGSIELKRVGFGYDEGSEHAVSGIDLKIKAGENVALVGASGSGKSTLANLIPLFYRPTEGTILVDGLDTSQLTLANLRNNISLVSQDIFLFNGSIRENIAYGCNSEADNEAILNAAKAANALEFIQRLPEGFETNIGDNGTRLSGGQRQRLAIARALLKDAPILVLDEATSALDSESEQLIQDAMQRLSAGRTTITIAHRLSTIENADKIIVLERGSIVEQGTHRELLEHGGIYSKLHSIQFKG